MNRARGPVSAEPVELLEGLVRSRAVELAELPLAEPPLAGRPAGRPAGPWLELLSKAGNLEGKELEQAPWASGQVTHVASSEGIEISHFRAAVHPPGRLESHHLA